MKKIREQLKKAHQRIPGTVLTTLGHQDEGRQTAWNPGRKHAMAEDIALDGPQQSIENNLHITEIKYFLPSKLFYNE